MLQKIYHYTEDLSSMTELIPIVSIPEFLSSFTLRYDNLPFATSIQE